MMTTTGTVLTQHTTGLVELVTQLEGQLALIAAGVISLSAAMLERSWTHSQLPDHHLAATELDNNNA